MKNGLRTDQDLTRPLMGDPFFQRKKGVAPKIVKKERTIHYLRFDTEFLL
jgi:hypothetical protein